MAWWDRNNLRLIQNNLREIDCNLDVDLLMNELNRFSANVLMMNAGGIVAFYPTVLEHQYRAAGQTKDLLKEAIDKTHANGMKFIARFDFSKAHESIFQRHPEWFYRSKDGQEVNYYGIVHTCLNGYYQREYSLKIIDEVISNYDVDGIFFNMFGYQNWDYSGNYYGTCFCDNCKLRFMDMYGLDLPDSEDTGDPVFRVYKEFQDVTTKQMLDRIHELVKSKPREIAISTYNEHKVDIVRKESNTAITRPHPVWLYSASENVKSLEDTWDDKLISNCCINAIDLFYRFTAVSHHEMNLRLYEALASGSGLDFCIIGVFDGYPDRANFADVQRIFRYHADNECYYGRFQSLADLALIKPGGTRKTASKEYLGMFKVLKEQHIQFDVIHENDLLRQENKLHRYRMILIPDIAGFQAEPLALFRQLHASGVHLLATGRSFTADDANRELLRDIFKVMSYREDKAVRSAYLAAAEKRIFSRFAERDWIMLDDYFGHVEFAPACRGVLRFVTPSTFGPPERASGHQVSESFGAAIHRSGSSGAAAYLPWNPGEHYYKYGYEDHKNVLLDVIDHVTEGGYVLTAKASPQAEIMLNRIDGQTCMLHVVNVSGFNGVTYLEPIPMHDLEITLRGIGPCRRAEELASGQPVQLESREDAVTVKLPVLQQFAAIVLHQS
ncbi:alpha-amylase family protein [Paenibacillus piri]|uniref:Beta-galactosidase trimerisation domain-containing protein n=1 Tax=Paenibacillus piri TaxID=2547395 RepID=A0A4R5KQN0_9BACL|nr:alpha-amylase family protein [Paenibacillus piri]TDF98069.1 hypothetical protein E1757_11205 [Paenibacillus piri]